MPALFAFGVIGSLLWLGFWALIIYGLWVVVRNNIPALKGIGPEDLSPFSAILTLFLLLAIIFLFQQIWVDLGRLAKESFNNFDSLELSQLIIRTIFIGPVTLIAIVVYFLVKGKGTRYGVVILPYFIASLIFLIRLLFWAGRFVLYQYETYGIYIVLIFIIFVITVLVFFIQKQFELHKKLEGQIQNNVQEHLSKTVDRKAQDLPKE